MRLLSSRVPRASVAERPGARNPVLHALVGTWPGRAVLIGGSVKLASLAARSAIGSTRWMEAIGSLGTLALLIGLAYFLVRLISLARKHLLWRVRRKLILSYILVGLVPLLSLISILVFGMINRTSEESRLAGK